MAVDLYSILRAGASSPEFDQGIIQNKQAQERQGLALEEGIGQFELSTRTIPDINRSQAAKGAFFTTATQRKASRAGEDEATRRARGKYEANRRIFDLLTASSLIPFGRTL